ncbi:hypothetical protein BDFB_003960 [Asbolus verrucosus]|uniref:Uncharacterized protein n=1 Tax=Asbolus verrucosus TaxID=1661398 RepID=A0A482VEP9_ASBVE|nr:hypothetical protein BDFB_003960 [Asbolus verrucosus]
MRQTRRYAAIESCRRFKENPYPRLDFHFLPNRPTNQLVGDSPAVIRHSGRHKCNPQSVQEMSLHSDPLLKQITCQEDG